MINLKTNLAILILTLALVGSAFSASYDEVWGDIQDEYTTEIAHQKQATNTDSAGKTIFKKFFMVMMSWLEKTYDSLYLATEDGFVTALTIFIVVLGLGMFYKGLSHAKIFIRLFVGSILFRSFIEFDVFNFWILDPMLSFMTIMMRVFLGAGAELGLADSIFYIDVHFVKIFNAIENYDDRLDNNTSWYQTHLLKTIVVWLMLGGFAFLYALFTTLIIIGFFGFFLLLGFFPLVAAISVFSGAFLKNYIKSVFNWLLLPIFTAAIMSVTLYFLADATGKINQLIVDDSIFTYDIALVFMVMVFSIALHIKAPDFAAQATGAMSSGAGGVIGTAAAFGAGAWGLSRSAIGGGTRNASSAISGATGGSLGQGSMSHRGGQALQDIYDKYRKGGRAMP